MKRNKVIAALAIEVLVIITIVINDYNSFRLSSNRTEETTESIKGQEHKPEPSSRKEENKSVSQTQEFNTSQTQEETPQSEPLQDSSVSLAKLNISIGMNRDAIMKFFDENQIEYQISETNAIGNEDMYVRFDDNDNACYISLETPTWTTSRGLSVKQSISQMEQLYGNEYSWEAFNHKGRYDVFKYSLGDVKLEILTCFANLKEIDTISLYSPDCVEEIPDERIDQWMLIDSSYLSLNMSKEELLYFISDEGEISTDTITNTINLLDKNGNSIMKVDLSEDHHIKCLYTDSIEATTGRGIKKGDCLDLVEEYYGTNYTSVETTGGIVITYEFSESKIEFGIKENEVFDIKVAF